MICIGVLKVFLMSRLAFHTLLVSSPRCTNLKCVAATNRTLWTRSMQKESSLLVHAFTWKYDNEYANYIFLKQVELRYTLDRERVLDTMYLSTIGRMSLQPFMR